MKFEFQNSYLNLAGSQAPAWEPLSCKLLLDLFSGSWSFKNPIPKQGLGNEQKLLRIVHLSINFLRYK